MPTTEIFPGAPVASPGRPGEASSDVHLDREGTGQLSVHVSESISAIELIRPPWSKWTTGLNTDFDYYLHGLKSDSTVLRPYVITVCEAGEPQAALVGLVRETRISTIVSSLRIRGPRARVLEIVAGGRIGTKSSAIDQLFVQQLTSALRGTDVDLLCAHRLSLDSELFRRLQQMSGLFRRARVPHVFHYSVVPLMNSSVQRERVFSGKNRREIRRKTRGLQQAFPDQSRFQCFSEFRDLEAALRDANSVDLTTWQHSLGNWALDELATRELLRFCAGRRWLRIYLMYISDLPVAFLIGQRYGRTFYCQHAGYRPEFARYSVGSLLTAWALQSLTAEGVEKVDLGEGGQEHNRRLGCEEHAEGTVHLYAPTLRGLRANLFFASAQFVRTTGRKAINTLRRKRPSRAQSQDPVRGGDLEVA